MAVQTKPTHFSQLIHKILSCREVRRNELELRAKGLGSLNDQTNQCMFHTVLAHCLQRYKIWSGSKTVKGGQGSNEL